MRYKVFIFVLLFQFKVRLSQINADNFGPYKWDWLKYESCKGPKRGECGTVHVKNTHNMSDVIYILDIAQDCPLTKNNGTTENKLWNYQLNNPCQHFVMGPILVNGFNLKNGCKITKGHYEIHVNMYEISRRFLGANFFYGTYSFKVMTFNEKNNFFCQLIAVMITKP